MELTNLEYLGLTTGEIRVFQALLEKGELSAANLVTASGLKKGDCYNKVYDLVKKGLVEEYDKQKKKHFRLLDPRKLEEVATSQYQTALQAKREVEAVLPGILSTYTLTYHKPGIVLFEGEDAMRRIPEDSLTATGEILQYIDTETINKHDPFTNYSASHAKKRKQLKIPKRMLIPDTQWNRNHAKLSSNEFTQYRLIPYQLPRFSTSMLIYDNKIAYKTLDPERMIGVIIEDAFISSMHRGLFEFTWQQSLPVS